MQKFFSDKPVVCSNKAEFPKLSFDLIDREINLYGNSPTAVRAQGGQLAKLALAFVEQEYAKDISRATKDGLSAVVDVRSHRLQAGMYPAIPGWHCDAVPRNMHTGQPDFGRVHPSAFHVCLLLSSEHVGVSSTEFVDDRHCFKVWHDETSKVYANLHDAVEKAKPKIIAVKDGDFVRFTQNTVHRAAPAHRAGVRMFFRFSMYANPIIANKIVGQTQVYLVQERNGW